MHLFEIETLPAAEMEALQSKRLASQVDRLRASGVPYWTEKLAGVGEIADINDLGSLPSTNKTEFRDAYPTGMLAMPLRDVVRVHASSGTSGKPTIVGYSAADIAIFAEANARCLAMAGGTADDVIHVAYGYGLFTGGLGVHYGSEALGAMTVPASGGAASFQIGLIADLEATGLACTPSFSLRLAEQAALEDRLDDIHLKWGLHGAEPWSEGLRNKIETAWGGEYRAFDLYGLSEVIGPGVAAECHENPGGMHVLEDHFYPEIVDSETGEALPEGETGELVLTTLSRQAQPVLRYRTGDITRILGGGCPCGRTTRRIDRLHGRADDMLIIRGVNVYPRAIEAILLDDPCTSGNFAIIIDRRGTMVELEARVELVNTSDIPRRDSIAAGLEKRLVDTLRFRMKVTVGDPGSVPRQETGKARRVFERVGDADPLA